MAEPRFSMTAEEDLPRTLRREKEAREREARERDSAFQAGPEVEPGYDYGADESYEPETVTVSYLQIPFLHLMMFFIKAVFAAIPALILLVIVAYLIGETLQSYIPWMRQFEIIIRPPTG